MSRGFFDNNKDIDSEAEIARRRTFIERKVSELKYKKEPVMSRQFNEEPYLI